MIQKMLKAICPAILLLAGVAGAQAQTNLANFNFPNGVNGVAIDYIAGRAYVLLNNGFTDGSNAVQVINTKTLQPMNIFSTGGPSGAIAVNVVTGTVYVAGTEGNGPEVVAFNPTTGARIATIPVSSNMGPGIVAIAVNPVKNEVFVSNDTDNNLVVINGATNAVTGTVSFAGAIPAGVAVNFLNNKVYVALSTNQVALYSVKTGIVTYTNADPNPSGNSVTGVAVDPDLGKAYVTNPGYPGTVDLFNGKDKLVKTLPVGTYATSVDVDYTKEIGFVANQEGTVSIIDGDEKEVIGTVMATSASGSNTVNVDSVQHTLWIAGFSDVAVFTE